MWGYTLAATRLNIRHTVWNEFQAHTPCTRHAHAMHTPCTRHAHAMPCPQADELQRALAALRPLGVAGVAALRAAIASHLRGRLCAGGAVDGDVTALQVSHGPLAWLQPGEQ